MNWLRTLSCSAILFTSAMPFAQLPPGMTMPNTEYMPFIMINPTATADMGLSPAVSEKEKNVVMQEMMSILPMVMGGKQPTDKAKMAKQMFAAFKKMQDATLAPLTPAQKARYRQLSLQFLGAAAIETPKVEDELGLSPAQRTKLADALSASTHASMKSVSSAQASAQADPMGTMQRIKSAQAETRANQDRVAKSVLTPAQWAKWQAMQGRKLPGITNLGLFG